MKKTMALAAVLCVIAIAFTGCVGNTIPKEQTVETIVTVWTGNGHDKAFLNEKIDIWNKTVGAKKNIKIDYIVQDGITNKLELAFTSDQAPDLFTGGGLRAYAEQKRIIDIESMPGGDEFLERFRPYLVAERHTVDKKIYGVPRTSTTYGLIYNVKMFKNTGLVDENGNAKPPKTLKELREYAKILTNPAADEYGIIFPGKFSAWEGIDIHNMSSATSGFTDMYNPATGEFDASAYVEVAQTIMGIKEDGSYFPGVEGLDNDPARARFGMGGIGMKTAGSYDYGVLTDQFPAEIEWAVAPFPSVDANNRKLQVMGQNPYLKINRKSVEKIGAEKLMEVYKFFYSEELIRDAYKRGIDLPLNAEWVDGVEIPDSMSTWKGFNELIKVSIPMGNFAPPTDMSGVTLVSFVNDIWPGKVPVSQIKQAMAENVKKLKAGVAKYKELNPYYDFSAHINPDYDPTIK